MAATPATTGGDVRTAGGFDPLYIAWKLLTNVKVALTLIGLAVLGGLLGVVIPQMPAPMRANPEARAAWLELQRGDFGALTPWFERLQLFEVFYSYWFNGLWALILLAVAVSSVSRIRPIVRTVRRPPKQVNDRYFELAHNRAAFALPGGVASLEQALRRRRYRVEVVREEEGATYLFAERFAWAHYGTLLSHLALLIFMVGALLTRFAGFDTTLALAEAKAGAPVFDRAGPGQIFVTMLDAHRGIDAEGNIVDFRSELEVRRGEEIVTCTTTVNDPCHAFGYKFHQAAFFDDLARLRIAAPDGRVLYDDIVDFNNEATVLPRLQLSAPDGRVLFEGAVAQVSTDPGDPATRADDVAVGVIGRAPSEVAVAWRVVEGEMRVLLTTPSGSVLPLLEGDRGAIEGLVAAFVGLQQVPALRIDDMPGALDPEAGVTVQLLPGEDAPDRLVLVGVDAEPLTLAEGGSARTRGGYTYTFGGQAEGSGINVRRDPGDTFIWVAVAMALGGLGITFYVPRRRLWAKVTAEGTQLAGMAERTARFSREMRQIGAEAGSPDALLPADLRRGED